MIDPSEITEKQTAAFWSKVRRGLPHECWEWTAARTNLGYGRFMIKRRPRYRSFKAHRLAYYLTHKSIDDRLVVMHSCDNPGCCNPAHLSLGTHKDNSADMCRKGRARSGLNIGRNNGMTKLTDDAVREIRTSRDNGVQLAARYGVTSTLIYYIKKGQARRHVP